MTSILDLPEEILRDVLEYIPSSLSRSVRVCRQWNEQLCEMLYAKPQVISTASYTRFESTLTANPEYGLRVKILDLTRVIGTLKTTGLPDVLRRCSNLREFYAAQAAFTPAMMQILPNLKDLRVLDLASCIERFEISRVLNYCSELRRLHTFRYPRCAVTTRYPIKQYPPSLKHLALRGGLRDDFVSEMAKPNHPTLSIETLLIAHAPAVTAGPMLKFISSAKTLRELTISWPMMRFHEDSLDAVLLCAPNLRFLSLSIDYITPRFFENAHANLDVLELRFSGVGKRRPLRADDLIDCLDDQEEDKSDQCFPRLSRLGISAKLAESLLDTESALSIDLVAHRRGVELYEAVEADEATM